MWRQDSKSGSREMENPIKQTERQRDILTNILKENGINIKIESVVCFSSPYVKLNLSLRESDRVFSGEKELAEYLNGRKKKSLLSKSLMKKIAEILMNPTAGNK